MWINVTQAIDRDRVTTESKIRKPPCERGHRGVLCGRCHCHQTEGVKWQFIRNDRTDDVVYLSAGNGSILSQEQELIDDAIALDSKCNRIFSYDERGKNLWVKSF